MAGTADAHGAALGVGEVANIKKTAGLDPNEHFHIPDDVYDFFSDIPGRGKDLETEWQAGLVRYQEEHPVVGAEFALRVAGKMPADWTKCIPSKEDLPTVSAASRKSAGAITNALGQTVKSVLVGTADLTPSCNVAFKDKVDFQSVRSLNTYRSRG